MLRPTISTGSSSKKTTHKYSNLEKPSIHGIVFAAKLSQINVRIAPIDGSNSGGISSTPVQDLWERSFKELGEENPEQLVSGLLLFYPCQLVGYLESNEEGIRKCLKVLALLATKDSSKLLDYNIANVQHNIQSRLFSNIVVRSMEPPLERNEVKSMNKNNKVKKSSFEQRLQLTKTLFQLLTFIRKQAPLSVKKAIDLVSEKMVSLLPEPSNVEAVAQDETIPDPLTSMSKNVGPSVILGEDEVWPMPKEAFQLNVILKQN